VPRPNESRRTTLRRSLPPRPTTAGPGERADEPAVERRGNRSTRLVEREAPYVMDELKRVFLVTATCIALLGALTVVDRMR
jgi:hypothetical protein